MSTAASQAPKPISAQLPLNVRLQDRAHFDAFEPGDNAEAVRALVSATGDNVLLTGPAGRGKTHLLQAVCRRSSAAYFPLHELREAGPELLTGLGAIAVVALDDLDQIAGDASWEQAVMRVIDARQTPGLRWIGSLAVAPSDAGFALPDLVSRLQTASVFRLKALDDQQRLRLLRRRFSQRGLQLDDAVGGYLLKHVPRDTQTLIAWVDKLDWASLSSRKKLTLPLVRQLLSREGLVA